MSWWRRSWTDKTGNSIPDAEGNPERSAFVCCLGTCVSKVQEVWIMNLRMGCALLLAGVLPAVLAGCRGHDWHYMDSGMSNSSTGASGEVVINKMGGGIDVANAPHGATLSTMGGGIHVGNVASFARVKTMGGGIDIDHATGSVDATTMGGGITINTAEGPVKATSMGGGITVREVGNSSHQRDIHLESKGGNIELTVPKDFAMDVKITLAYTRTDRHYKIVQHAGLDVHESSEWDNSHGTPRKYIRAGGIVGSGTNRVTIETVNGNVILNQE
jgi:DUF4097 and DUF4098 domain-containing protein YvlB